MTVAQDCNASFMRWKRFALDLSLRKELQKTKFKKKELCGCAPLPMITKTVNLLLQTDFRCYCTPTDRFSLDYQRLRYFVHTSVHVLFSPFRSVPPFRFRVLSQPKEKVMIHVVQDQWLIPCW